MQAHQHGTPVNNAGAGSYSGSATTYTSNVINQNGVATTTTGGGDSQNLQPYRTTRYVVKT